MPSPSPFDDLLSELDAPLDDVKAADPRREEVMEGLIKASKRLEAIAQTLDPSDPKHPLSGKPIPDGARGVLKRLVEELMRTQAELQAIEQEALRSEAEEAALAAKTKPTPAESAALRPREGRRDPFEDHETARSPSAPRPSPFSEDDVSPDPFARPSPWTAPVNADPIETDTRVDVIDPHPASPPAPAEDAAALPQAAPEPAPPAAEPVPAPPPPTPGPDLAALRAEIENEKAEFAAYRAQWEAVFQTQPNERTAHPEVEAYYAQMDTYFKEKDAYLAAHQNGA